MIFGSLIASIKKKLKKSRKSSLKSSRKPKKSKRSSKKKTKRIKAKRKRLVFKKRLAMPKKKKKSKKRKVLKRPSALKKKLRAQRSKPKKVKRKPKAKKRILKRRKKVSLKKKKIIRKSYPKAMIVKPVAQDQCVGEVTHYFSRIEVCVVKMTQGRVNVGDKICIKGHSTDFSQKILSLQIENSDVKTARKGQLVGLKVKSKVREGDKVFKLL